PALPREGGVPTKSRWRGADFVGWEGGGRYRDRRGGWTGPGGRGGGPEGRALARQRERGCRLSNRSRVDGRPPGPRGGAGRGPGRDRPRRRVPRARPARA